MISYQYVIKYDITELPDKKTKQKNMQKFKNGLLSLPGVIFCNQQTS